MSDAPTAVPQAFQELFQTSMDKKQGLTVFFDGQQVPGIVTDVSDQIITMRSQQYDRIVVRIDQINALALS